MRKNASTGRYGNKPPKNHMKILTNGKFFLIDGAHLGFLFSNDEDKPLLKTGQLCVGVRKRLIKKLNGDLENCRKISIFAKKVIDNTDNKIKISFHLCRKFNGSYIWFSGNRADHVTE